MGIPKAAENTINFILNKFNLVEARGYQPTVIPDYGRDDLAELFAELNLQSIVEIGVERALYSRVLARANPQARVYGIDGWKAYQGYRDHVSQSRLDEFYEKTLERMSHYPNWQAIRKFSMEAVKDFRDGELDAVYIDGNHTLPFVINDMIEWTKKVRIGGIVSGHDYRKSKRIVTQNHVPYAVHCFVESYRIRPWFLLGTKAVNSGEVRDETRSWMWVRIR